MSQNIQTTNLEIQQKQHLKYSLNKEITKNESENESIRFKKIVRLSEDNISANNMRDSDSLPLYQTFLEDNIRQLGKTDKK